MSKLEKTFTATLLKSPARAADLRRHARFRGLLGTRGLVKVRGT